MGSEVLQGLVAGLGTGGMYAFIAIGYTLILSASGVFNLALGAVVMGGTLSFYGVVQVANWPALSGFALVLVGGAVLGFLTCVLSTIPVFNRPAVSEANFTEITLIATFGFGLMLTTIAGIFFGYNTDAVNSYVSTTPIMITGVAVQPIYVVMVSVMIIVALGLEWVFKRTHAGLVFRATVEEPEGAQLGGISVRRVAMYAFAGGSAIAAVAGAMLGPIVFASASSSGDFILYGTAAMAIGGFGSFSGAILGGLVVGLITELTPVFISGTYSNLLIYGFMVLLFLISPAGLLGSAGKFGRTVREV